MRHLLIAAAVCAAAVTLAPIAPASATSGPGCLRVVNVPEGDVLHIRKRPRANARSVAVLYPDDWGVLHLDAPCTPQWRPWGERWCPVSNYQGEGVVRGWVKARFVRDSLCP